MTAQLIDVQAVAPQPWRNGGGQTRELLAWPSEGPWQLRISRADIDADGPFSAFAGVTRWFAVLSGNGVCLTLDGAPQRLRPQDDALCFDGAQAPSCALLDGPTQDLNLMHIGGAAVMRKAIAGVAWDGDFHMRGLYTTQAGYWQHARGEQAVPAHSLLWDAADAPGSWCFRAASDAHGTAWWLGFNPKD